MHLRSHINNSNGNTGDLTGTFTAPPSDGAWIPRSVIQTKDWGSCRRDQYHAGRSNMQSMWYIWRNNSSRHRSVRISIRAQRSLSRREPTVPWQSTFHFYENALGLHRKARTPREMRSILAHNRLLRPLCIRSNHSGIFEPEQVQYWLITEPKTQSSL